MESVLVGRMSLIGVYPPTDLIAAALDTFEEKWAGRYAFFAPDWREAWQDVIPFSAFDPSHPQDHLYDERFEKPEPRDPQMDQNVRIFARSGGREKAHLSFHPQLRDRWQKCQRLFAARNQFTNMFEEGFNE